MSEYSIQNRNLRCCICQKKFVGFGHNPDPVNTRIGARCCNDCNYTYVIPERMRRFELGLPIREVS